MARPRQNAEAKDAKINLRVTPTFRAVIQECAVKAGRTLSQECEIRLKHSLEWEYKTELVVKPVNREPFAADYLVYP